MALVRERLRDRPTDEGLIFDDEHSKRWNCFIHGIPLLSCGSRTAPTALEPAFRSPHDLRAFALHTPFDEQPSETAEHAAQHIDVRPIDVHEIAGILWEISQDRRHAKQLTGGAACGRGLRPYRIAVAITTSSAASYPARS